MKLNFYDEKGLFLGTKESDTIGNGFRYSIKGMVYYVSNIHVKETVTNVTCKPLPGLKPFGDNKIQKIEEYSR